MKVIILEEDRIADVADGYARNYLFPKKLAILATPLNIEKFEKRLKERSEELLQKKKIAQELADKLSSVEVLIKAEAGEEGKLFGSITIQDVINAVKQQLGIELDKRKVNLNEHIKMVGTYIVIAKLHHEVNANIKLKVERL